MALKSTDILLVQRGDQSYQMPASQLAASDSEVAPDLQTVTDKGNTTTNSIHCGDRDPSQADNYGVRIALDSSNGGCYVQAKSTASPSSLMAFQAVHGTNEKFLVKYDGTAVFADAITSGDASSGNYMTMNQGALTIRRDNTAFDCIRVFNGGTTDPGDKTVGITSTGLSYFAGTMQIAGDTSSAAGTIIQKEGGVYSYRADAQASSSIFQGGTLTDRNAVDIFANGSATFKQVVTSNNEFRVITGASSGGFRTFSDVDGARFVVSNNAGNSNKVEINNNGSALFGAGTLTIGNDGALRSQDSVGIQTSSRGNTQNLFLSDDGQINLSAYGSGELHIGGTLSGSASSSAPKIKLTPTGTAIFNTAGNGHQLSESGWKTSFNTTGSSYSWFNYTGGVSGPSGMGWHLGDTNAVANAKVSLGTDGTGYFAGRVRGSNTVIQDGVAWDMAESNFWTFAGGTLANPTNITAACTGVIYVAAEANSYGNLFSFPGGSAPTIPANSVVPYFVDVNNKIRLGAATEGFV